jgi:hypothetical protein
MQDGLDVGMPPVVPDLRLMYQRIGHVHAQVMDLLINHIDLLFRPSKCLKSRPGIRSRGVFAEEIAQFAIFHPGTEPNNQFDPGLRAAQ